jgi:alpha-tubulin suppressor-like RCC1 family protein
MSRFNLVRLASWVLLAGTAILLSSDGEAQVHRIGWTGSVTCTITLTGMDSLNGMYSDTQQHKWEILPGFESRNPPRISYPYIWTVTGGGAKPPESEKWVTNGRGGDPPNFEGRITFDKSSNGNLIIHTTTAQLVDLSGITVTKTDASGTSTTFPANAFEEKLPNITAPWGSTDVNGHISQPMLTRGSYNGGFQEPGDVIVNGMRIGYIDANRDCDWHFHFGDVLMSSPPPGSTLSLPDKPDPAHPDKPAAPEGTGRDRPPPPRPAVALATVSVFFGGPGNGTVTAPRYSCTSDCTVGYFSQGSTITLTATPDATSVFAGWGGLSCSGLSPTCRVTLGASTRVIAYFRSMFRTVAAGAYHSCVLRPAGDVVCWGRNAEGQIGTGMLTNTPVTPSAGKVTGISNAVAIAAGGHHTCALIAGGTVSCWGKNNVGQIGDGSRFGASNATPTTVLGITEALTVTAGGAHSCVVHAGGSASCWGLNKDNQLGASTTYDFSFSPVPVALGLVGPFSKQIAAGGFHTCAIVAADSTVFCWGLNSDGQLGLGTAEIGEYSPRVVVDPGCTPGFPGDCPETPQKLLPATAIAASIGVGQLLGGSPLGGYHTVALDSSGTDWGWGNNNDGQTFTGSLWGAAVKDPSPPSPMPTKIAAGAYHTCILEAATAGVFCRGNNDHGQSGPPGFVPMTAFSVDVAAGGYHTCAVIVLSSTPPAGSVECWGRNWDGEVDGTTSGSDVTTPVVLTEPP